MQLPKSAFLLCKLLKAGGGLQAPSHLVTPCKGNMMCRCYAEMKSKSEITSSCLLARAPQAHACFISLLRHGHGQQNGLACTCHTRVPAKATLVPGQEGGNPLRFPLINRGKFSAKFPCTSCKWEHGSCYFCHFPPPPPGLLPQWHIFNCKLLGTGTRHFFLRYYTLINAPCVSVHIHA